MGRRLELHQVLLDLLGSGNVYFQPPENIVLAYPCIVYGQYLIKTEFADNESYKNDTSYQVTVIDRDPDTLIPGKVKALPRSRHSRSFVADNLNHYVFNLYY